MKFNYKFVLNGGTYRQAVFEGKDHLIFPVIMQKAAVLEGMNGIPIYYSADELRKYPAAWNNQPVPVYHPTDVLDNPISANSPEVMEERVIGRLFNTIFDEAIEGLKSEIWIDIEKADKVDKDLLPMLKANEKVDVSTGLVGDYIEEPGEFDGKKYDGYMVNIIPDHLALLPGGKGACSWEDGCGVRANSKKYKPQAYYHVTNEAGMKEIEDQLVKLLRKEVGNNQWVYIEDLWRDKAVYFVESNTVGNFSNGHFEIGYKTDKKGNVALNGNPKEVRRKITYVSVNQKKRKEKNMACQEKVKAVLKRFGIKDSDGEFLNEANDEQLDILATHSIEVVKDKVVEKEVVKMPEFKTLEEVLEVIPEDFKTVVNQGITAINEKKGEMVKKILAVEGCQFTEDQLNEKSMEDLEMLGSLVKEPTNNQQHQQDPDFSASGGHGITIAHAGKDGEEEGLSMGKPFDKEEK